MKNQKLLQHRPTGRIFAWNEDLSKRADMIDYVPQPKAHVEAAPAQAASADDDIKAMARAVLTKKPGRKANGEAGVGQTESQEEE